MAVLSYDLSFRLIKVCPANELSEHRMRVELSDSFQMIHIIFVFEINSPVLPIFKLFFNLPNMH